MPHQPHKTLKDILWKQPDSHIHDLHVEMAEKYPDLEMFEVLSETLGAMGYWL